MTLAEVIQSIPKAVKLGALSSLFFLRAINPVMAEENYPEKKVADDNSSHLAIGASLGFPHLAALRLVYGWDKKVGFQTDISPFFLSADMRLRYDKLDIENLTPYGFLGGVMLMPWLWASDEIDSPVAGANFGFGVEWGKKQKGFYLGGEFGFVIPFEIPADTVGMRMNVNGGYRF